MNEDLDALAAHTPLRHRRGKIARLSKETRDQLNAMLDDGLPYADILKRLADKAPGLTENNISNWHSGGYQDWALQQLQIDFVNARHEMALDLLRETSDSSIQEASRQIVATQISEVIARFDYTVLLERLHAHPELYPRLITGLARLSEAELACAHHRSQQAMLKARLAQQQATAKPKIVTEETIQLIRNALANRPLTAKPGGP